MYYTVYKITCKTTGKYYIGKHQTKDLNDGYFGSGKLIRHAIEKHGKHNFKKDILHVFETEEEMNAAEIELVNSNDPHSYNICPGGQGGFGYINETGKAVHINEQRKRNPELYHKWQVDAAKLGGSAIVQKRLEQGLTPWGTNLGDGFRGRKHTEETKRKMSAADRTGKKNSQFGTMWITNGLVNKKIKKVDKVPDGWYNGRILKKSV